MNVRLEADSMVVAEATCDSLLREVEWWISRYDSLKADLTRYRSDYDAVVEKTETFPRTALIMFLVGLTAGFLGAILLKNRQNKESWIKNE